MRCLGLLEPYHDDNYDDDDNNYDADDDNYDDDDDDYDADNGGDDDIFVWLYTWHFTDSC